MNNFVLSHTKNVLPVDTEPKAFVRVQADTLRVHPNHFSAQILKVEDREMCHPKDDQLPTHSPIVLFKIRWEPHAFVQIARNFLAVFVPDLGGNRFRVEVFFLEQLGIYSAGEFCLAHVICDFLLLRLANLRRVLGFGVSLVFVVLRLFFFLHSL